MFVSSGKTDSARAELSAQTELLFPFAVRGLATLGVADVLAAGPMPVEAIADAVGADADALYRTMRFTASRGVFAQTPGRVFSLTPSAEYLRSDAPDSLRPRLVIDESLANRLRVLSEVVHTLKTGESGFHKIVGVGPFEAMAQDRSTAQRGDRQLGGGPHGAQTASAPNGLKVRQGPKIKQSAAAKDVGQPRQRPRLHGGPGALAENVAAAADFSAEHVVVDVGGGTGATLGAILARNAHLTGVLFDLPAVVAEAPAVLRGLGVSQRCELASGDMFEGVPAGADSYLLSCVLHDWQDDRAVAVLANVRAAMPSHARLLVVEALIGEDGPAAAQAAQQDFMLLVNGGGRERTADEHAALLARAGFKLTGVREVGSGFSLLEARPEPAGAS